jgi:hypothetical protein
MRERPFLFLVVCLLMFCGKNFGQKNPQKFPGISNYNAFTGDKLKSLPGYFVNKQGKELLSPNFKNSYSQPGFSLLNGLLAPAYSSLHTVPVVSSSFYCNSLGIICKKEIQLEKITSVPFRLRLGSLEYVNYLEQKPNSSKPVQ